MAELPQLTDYVHLIIELFGRFRQERSASAAAKLGLTRHPLTTSLTPAVLPAAHPHFKANPPNPRPDNNPSPSKSRACDQFSFLVLYSMV